MPPEASDRLSLSRAQPLQDHPMKRERLHLIVASFVCLVGMSAGTGLAAASQCADSPIGRVSTADGNVRVTVPHVPGLESNDILLQLNSHRLHVCDDLAGALEEARGKGLDVLLLVERKGRVHAVRVELPVQPQIAAAAPVATVADTVPAQVPTRSPVTSPTQPPPVSPTAARPTAVPTPLTSADVALVREAIVEANQLGHELQDSLPLLSSQPWLGRLRRLLDDQARRRERNEAAAAAEPIFAYYETIAQILAYAEKATRDARRRRSRAQLVLEYDSTSDVSGWLKRYPFLAESVIEPPKEITFLAHGERPGRWLPNRAIELLVERALAEGTDEARAVTEGTP